MKKQEIEQEAIMKVMELCYKVEKDVEMFQVGGSLLEHESKDIDILVKFSKYESLELHEAFKDHIISVDQFSSLICIDYDLNSEFVDSQGAFNPYQSIPVLPKFLVTPSEGFNLVVKLTLYGINIDLLCICDRNKYRHEWLLRRISHFPLSIQQIAKNLKTGEIIRSIWQESDTIFYSVEGKSLDKYRRYYPDREFKPL